MRLFAFIGVAISMIATSTHAQGNPLQAYQWESRPVLIFAPATTDDRIEAMMPGDAVDRGVKDRDIAIIVISGDGVDPASLQATALQLRQKYNVSREQFTVILVGKDGGEKARWDEPPSWEEDIFPLIDSMPMRRREMQNDQ